VTVASTCDNVESHINRRESSVGSVTWGPFCLYSFDKIQLLIIIWVSILYQNIEALYVNTFFMWIQTSVIFCLTWKTVPISQYTVPGAHVFWLIRPNRIYLCGQFHLSWAAEFKHRNISARQYIFADSATQEKFIKGKGHVAWYSVRLLHDESSISLYIATILVRDSVPLVHTYCICKKNVDWHVVPVWARSLLIVRTSVGDSRYE
jgi:hypothetical protein